LKGTKRHNSSDCGAFSFFVVIANATGVGLFAFLA
jgi:hypothetical protein